eukprot:TRINITY_DN24048_c0_g1_i3.p5 TRINITY_DN24048_c0_g1~~TRINITY_DN24048_c0_g1_i3.p5  ORF type:complete len:124 (+),score=1.27 TRINITY_DN24048_c0_g1_i3:729-1100(+)
MFTYLNYVCTYFQTIQLKCLIQYNQPCAQYVFSSRSQNETTMTDSIHTNEDNKKQPKLRYDAQTNPFVAGNSQYINNQQTTTEAKMVIEQANLSPPDGDTHNTEQSRAERRNKGTTIPIVYFQ